MDPLVPGMLKDRLKENASIVQDSSDYVSTILSLSHYRDRITRVSWSIVATSLLAAGVTLMLSLGFANGIVAAMGSIRAGKTAVSVPGSAVKAIDELSGGFDDMARTLDGDKAAIAAHIAEILGLKEYSEGIIESIREGLAVVGPDGRVEKANRVVLRRKVSAAIYEIKRSSAGAAKAGGRSPTLVLVEDAGERVRYEARLWCMPRSWPRSAS